jgi:hypothetical protein
VQKPPYEIFNLIIYYPYRLDENCFYFSFSHSTLLITMAEGLQASSTAAECQTAINVQLFAYSEQALTAA